MTADFPTASGVRRKRRPPPWKSLIPASHTKIQTTPRYAQTHPGSAVYTVDISAAATELCRSIVSPCVKIHTGDSVQFLKRLSDSAPADLAYVDLLYLDSYDVSFEDATPSAIHHLKELAAAVPLLQSGTLVVVDDSPMSCHGIVGPGREFKPVSQLRVGGKGRLVAEYAQSVGAEKIFHEYQCGWIGMRGAASDQGHR